MYNGEYFERGKTRYIVFAVVILLVIVASVFSSNITGAVLVLIFAGGYVYYLTKTNDKIQMKIGKNSLQIGKSTIPWNSLTGFVLEYHTKKEVIHNIVLLNEKGYNIYTISDKSANLENFVNELSNYIPMIDKYEQSTFDKFIRKIKL